MESQSKIVRIPRCTFFMRCIIKFIRLLICILLRFDTNCWKAWYLSCLSPAPSLQFMGRLLHLFKLHLKVSLKQIFQTADSQEWSWQELLSPCLPCNYNGLYSIILQFTHRHAYFHTQIPKRKLWIRRLYLLY